MPNTIIRKLNLSDAVTSVKWRNIPELWVHTKFKATKKITLDDEEEWLQKAIDDPTSVRFAIVADEEYIGNIYLTDITKSSAEYHIFIGERRYWGKGIARAASILIIDYGKNVLKLKKIMLYVKKENRGACHLYSSLGFVENGLHEDGFFGMELDLLHWKGDPRAKMR